MYEMMIYCERSGDGFWAEPLNALSSLAFVFAAVVAYRRWRGAWIAADGSYRWDLPLLMGLMAAVGVGGFLWHTLATDWAEWADRIPILAFINIYLMSLLYRGLRVDGFSAVLVLLGFQWLMVTTGGHLATLLPNGSAFYVPALAVLGLAGLYAANRQGARAWPFLAAFVLFGIALSLRTADMALCPLWLPGTHFLWHLLTAWVLYLAMAGLMIFIQPAGESAVTARRGMLMQ